MTKIPKGLIIEHNPLSLSTGNGKTVASLLSCWPNDRLAQIFITSLEPDFNLCKNYFRITDIEIVKAYIKKNINVGQEILEHDVNSKTVQIQSYPIGKVLGLMRIVTHWSSAILMRDIIWGKGRWKTRELESWVEKISPDFVFLGASNLTTTFEMAMWICTTRKIPLIIHVGDDYYIRHQSFSVFYHMQLKRMKKCFTKAVAYSDCVIAIGEKMAHGLKEHFGGVYNIAMNSVDIENEPKEYFAKNSCMQLVYTGNLSLKRWRVLRDIGRALQYLSKSGIEAKLRIYSSFTPSKRILRKLTLPPYMEYVGSVYGDELRSVRESADVLVHVETFSKQHRHLLRTAISTKIPEYMISKRVIFAIGPDDAASIQYLSENKIAEVVKNNSVDSIKKSLYNLLNDGTKMKHITQEAYELCKEHHSKEKKAVEILNIIINACDNY